MLNKPISILIKLVKGITNDDNISTGRWSQWL